jgi:hypothetical protein
MPVHDVGAYARMRNLFFLAGEVTSYAIGDGAGIVSGSRLDCCIREQFPGLMASGGEQVLTVNAADG